MAVIIPEITEETNIVWSLMINNNNNNNNNRHNCSNPSQSKILKKTK